MEKEVNWWNNKTRIPINDSSFVKIISFYVFECPASHKSGGGNDSRGNKRPVTYRNVSARNTTFRNRHITGGLLNTILAEIRRPLVRQGTFSALNTDVSVEDQVKSICATVKLNDSQFDLIVYHRR